jgi:inorganic phosphate transporter, PiT family
MSIGLLDFLSQFVSNPALAITVVLTLAVILVNGWTDAPNAIATCVSTRAIHPKAAILMAAVFNFLGVFVMTMFNATVAQTIYKMVNFEGDSKNALVALCAAMVAIVIWATAAWVFGIPTSESHALIAGLSGAAIALQNSISGINLGEWTKVLYGLVLSTFLGFFMGWIIVKLIEFICRKMDKRKTNEFLEKHKLVAVLLWHLCMEHRMVRNLWVFLCLECSLHKEIQQQQNSQFQSG